MLAYTIALCYVTAKYYIIFFSDKYSQSCKLITSCNEYILATLILFAHNNICAISTHFIEELVR